jgi:hypothetical protein
LGEFQVARAAGVSRRALTEGMKALRQQKTSREGPSAHARIRRKGAGRNTTVDKDPILLKDLDRLVDPVTRGEPESRPGWTCKSVRRLAEELQQKDHALSYRTVAELLHVMGYNLQAGRKTPEGSQHAQRYLNQG